MADAVGEMPEWVRSFRAAARVSGRRRRSSKTKKEPKKSLRPSRRSLALLSQEQSFILDVFRPDDGVLDLGGQHLGDAVVDAVATSWPFFKRRLKRLHLGGNDITDEGLAKLIEAIQEQPSRQCKLLRLNLRGNHLGPSSAEALAALLPLLPMLESLDLGGNGLDPSAAQFPGLKRVWV